MCLEGTTEGWVGVDGTDGGGETVPYVGDGHWEGTLPELRPASFDGSGSSSRGAKLAYIRVGRSKHDKAREATSVVLAIFSPILCFLELFFPELWACSPQTDGMQSIMRPAVDGR